MKSHPLTARVQALAPKSSAEEVWGGMEALGEGGRIKVTLLSTKTNAGFGLPQVFRTSVYSIYYMMFTWYVYLCVYLLTRYCVPLLRLKVILFKLLGVGWCWWEILVAPQQLVWWRHTWQTSVLRSNGSLPQFKRVLGASSYISSWKGWSHHNFRIILWNRRLQVRLLGQESLWAFTVFFKMLPSDGIL